MKSTTTIKMTTKSLGPSLRMSQSHQ